MFVRRAVSILAVVSFALIIPSGQDLVLAVNQALATCHDNVWDPGEYCGHDAVAVTTVADMNHDCLVDGLDIGLFAMDYGATGSNLSGDFKSSGAPGPPPCGGNILCPDGKVNNVDFAFFATKIGLTASPCTSVPIPEVCDGKISLSFSTNPSTIVNNAAQATGAQTVYVVMSNVTNARIAEYSVQTSANIQITNHTGYVGLPMCQDINSVALGLPAPTSGPIIIGTIHYQLNNTAPAIIRLVKGPCSIAKLRWSDGATTLSHNFATITHAGINGPTPTPNGCPGTVSGRVYADIASNCAYNSPTPDFPRANRQIEVTPGPVYAYTKHDGTYSLKITSGSYTVTQAPLSGDTYTLPGCQAASYPVSIPPGGTSSNKNFALTPGAAQCDVSVSLVDNGGTGVGCPGNQPFRSPCPNSENEYLCIIKLNINATTFIPTGKQVNITLDPVFTIATVTSAWPTAFVSSSGGNQQTIQLNDAIYPGDVCVVKVRATPSVTGPYTGTFTFSDGGLCTGTKTASLTETNMCSCDPNDMTVVPTGCGPEGFIAGNTPLLYKIRFENIGSGPATTVMIEAPLDDDLDLSTFALVTSSHTATDLQIVLDNILVVNFEGINLPGTGGGNNKGYVLFTIKPKTGLSDGTTIENFAAITFDGNVPVYTNTVLNTIQATPSGCTDDCQDGVWQDGEYCGFDAYLTTGYPDINHDCVVDGLDMGIWGLQFGSVGDKLSADIDGSDSVDSNDLSYLSIGYGQVISSGCTSSAAPDDCKGKISLSHSSDPNNIVDLAFPSTGSHNAYVVVDNAAGAQIVEYSLELGNQITILDQTLLVDGAMAYACDSQKARVFSLVDPLPAGPTAVVMIEYFVNATVPSYMKIVPLDEPCDGRVRWTTEAANPSYDFLYLTNIGINGSVPPPSSNTCTPTAVPRDETPRVDQLSQNVPNPFNPATTIAYALASQKRVSISIYNVRGQLVRTLVDATLPAGQHSVEWNGRDQSGGPVASGVYLYRMIAGSHVETKKLVLLK